MSMQPRPWPQIPRQTAVVARAAFPHGSLAMRLRDELGEVYRDEDFVAMFGRRGKPGISPAQLMLVLVLQYAEDLTDRQAALLVRRGIDVKYLLGLELDDPGFDASVLCEFRGRLVGNQAQRLVLDRLLARAGELGLLPAGRQRTDSTKVLAAIRSLSRLELAGESVRAALETLAGAAPGWLATVIDESWQHVYGARVDELHLPDSESRRGELAVQFGEDGRYLLERVHDRSAPAWLRELAAVQALRMVLVQQYAAVQHGDGRIEVIWREPEVHGLPPASLALISPYDTDARYAVKRGEGWGGYAVHISETCLPPPAGGQADGTAAQDAELPNLITNVTTMPAPAGDQGMTEPIHHELERRGLLPDEHLVDSGYVSAGAIVAARARAVELIGPALADCSAQARAGQGYGKASFTFDFDARRGICPQGVASSSWNSCTQHGTESIVVTWATADCRRCPARELCTRGKRRQITIRDRQLHQALEQARAQQGSQEWKRRYNVRAGVEGTMRQATHVTGIRRARCLGLPKVSLEHNIAAAAVNMIRLDSHWTGHPLSRTRATRLASLNLTWPPEN